MVYATLKRCMPVFVSVKSDNHFPPSLTSCGLCFLFSLPLHLLCCVVVHRMNGRDASGVAIRRTHYIDLENSVSRYVDDVFTYTSFYLIHIQIFHIITDIPSFTQQRHTSALYLQNYIDACAAQWKDIKLAMKAKAESDEEKAQQILAQTHYKKNLGSDLKQSPTANVIWDLKEKPCWDEVE